jgi:electron transfer flavoprotein beta subunit
MKIVVLIKQVPDMERVKFDRERGVIDRKSAGTEINPFDLNALEAAVGLSEIYGAEVIALSMGPPSTESALKEAIARGATQGILLSDRKFGGADVKATANTLAAGIKNIGDFDMIFAGMQTVDGDTGQVGPEVAELLDIPHISYAESIEASDEKSITVACDIWNSSYVKKAQFPVLITVTKDINSPRLPSFKSKSKARKAEIPVWGLAELSAFITADDVGLTGSATKVKKIQIPDETARAGQLWRDETPKALNNLIQIFTENKILEESI